MSEGIDIDDKTMQLITKEAQTALDVDCALYSAYPAPGTDLYDEFLRKNQETIISFCLDIAEAEGISFEQAVVNYVQDKQEKRASLALEQSDAVSVDEFRL